MLTAIGENQWQLTANLIASSIGDAQAARFADRFKSRGDVHAVTENIVAVYNNVADIDTDAENDALLIRDFLVAVEHLALNRDGAGDRVHNAGKIHQDTIADSFNDASAVGGDGRIDLVLADPFERAQRADFVGSHQAAITDDVGGKNGGELALYVLMLFHTEGLHRQVST